MKRFEFRLQAVLTLRQRVEQKALERYARAIECRQAAAERFAQAERELSEARRQWLNAMADGCPAAHAAQTLGFCHSIEKRCEHCAQSLHLADIELNQASQQMLLARQQREVVERFLGRQRGEYDRLLRAEERKLIDDLVGRRPPMSLSGRSSIESSWN